MNEYLTTKELSQRIKIARQTLYNKKYQGEFQQGVHFLQPSRKKTLWIWSAMKEWLEKASPNKLHETDHNDEERSSEFKTWNNYSAENKSAHFQPKKVAPIRKSIIKI